MLGKNQKSILDRYLNSVNSGSEPVTLLITIHQRRKFTRESGGGSGYPISAKLRYENGDTDFTHWLSTATERYSAIQKAQEIARYWLAIGVNRDVIKIESQIGGLES